MQVFEDQAMSRAGVTPLGAAARRLDEAYGADHVPRASGGVFPIFPMGLTKPRGPALRRIVAREGARRTIETGCGLGVSALCIAAGVDDALMASGHSAAPAGVSHTAVDPVQNHPDFMDGAGRMLVASAGLGDRFTLIEEPSEYALPRLAKAGEQFDLAFVDGAHQFEHVLIDIVMLQRLVRRGGLIVVDDVWMRSVRSAVSYAERNLGLIREPAAGEGEEKFAALRVATNWHERAMDHFEPFETPGA